MSTVSTKKSKPLAITVFASLAIGALALTGCTSNNQQSAAPSVSQAESDAFLSANNLAGLDARQMIDKLDSLPVAERPSNLMASVRPDELILIDKKKQQVSLPIPQDQFYLSFAPFKTQTHDCHFHSLTTCLGEMQNEEVTVTITDVKTGEKIVDKTVKTFDNGFVGVWLPRGIEATLSVEQGELSATSPISTATSEDATCLTTMQLS
ncbi:CueP family metal-binding protein [Arthrobacter sp. MYb227]|uniref:CueP family metal-binding protein n=1 Tax=Arthrobacter sp. MYb227 TaxID=1848601 RepID=UPI0015E37137|nr:CueP family metal-binding protein [Arthrobacter sp. MYb227]